MKSEVGVWFMFFAVVLKIATEILTRYVVVDAEADRVAKKSTE